MKNQRCLGCRIARELRKSLRSDDGWTVSAVTAPGMIGAVLSRGTTVRIHLYPNDRCPCLRMFDVIRLIVNGVDVYLPPVSRLCLRKAARRRVQRYAFNNI